MRFKAIIFDWGDVLSTRCARAILRETAQRFAIPENDILQAYIDTVPPYELGRLSSSDFVRSFLHRLGSEFRFDPASVLELPLRSWTEPDPEMIELAEKVHKRFKTALLSNNIREVVERIRAKLDLSHLFDVVVFSNEVGLRKPDPRIYTLCLERLHVRARDAVFIDNHENLCKGAEAVGIKSLLFTDRAKLLEDFSALGIEP
jgi:putative hydrolase of the HAD superfamily